MNTITIRGIRGYGYHGVLDHERQQGQEFIVDVVYEVGANAAATDQIEHAVHYGEVAEAVHQLIVGAPVNLIETLAHLIAERVLGFAGVDRVSITVHKPQAPIPVPFDDVAVTVVRERVQ